MLTPVFWQGYIHPKVVDVSPAKGGKGVVVSTRKPNAPANQIQKAALAHNLKSLGSSRKTNKSVGTLVGKYRPELKTVRTSSSSDLLFANVSCAHQLAVARASGILRAQRARKEGKAPRVRGQKTKAAKKTSA